MSGNRNGLIVSALVMSLVVLGSLSAIAKEALSASSVSNPCSVPNSCSPLCYSGQYGVGVCPSSDTEQWSGSFSFDFKSDWKYTGYEFWLPTNDPLYSHGWVYVETKIDVAGSGTWRVNVTGFTPGQMGNMGIVAPCNTARYEMCYSSPWNAVGQVSNMALNITDGRTLCSDSVSFRFSGTDYAVTPLSGGTPGLFTIYDLPTGSVSAPFRAASSGSNCLTKMNADVNGARAPSFDMNLTLHSGEDATKSSSYFKCFPPVYSSSCYLVYDNMTENDWQAVTGLTGSFPDPYYFEEGPSQSGTVPGYRSPCSITWYYDLCPVSFLLPPYHPPTITSILSTLSTGQWTNLYTVSQFNGGTGKYTCQWLRAPPGASWSALGDRFPCFASDEPSINTGTLSTPGTWSFKLQFTDNPGTPVTESSNIVTINVNNSPSPNPNPINWIWNSATGLFSAGEIPYTGGAVLAGTGGLVAGLFPEVRRTIKKWLARIASYFKEGQREDDTFAGSGVRA